MNRHLAYFHILVLTFVLAIAGCAPAAWNRAERAAEGGDIVNAVRYSVQTLHEEPGYEEALALLRRHIPRAYDDWTRRAERAAAGGDWDEAYESYVDIETMSDAIAGLPTQVHPETGEEIDFPTHDVSERIEDSRRNAAGMHYERGRDHENAGRAKEAARAYSRTIWYIPSYQDAGERYENNRQAAVQRVAVLPFRNHTGVRPYRGMGGIIADRVILEAMRDPQNMEFMEFVTRENIDEITREIRFGQSGFVDTETSAEIGRLLGVSAFVVGGITSISTDYPPDVVERFEERDEVSAGKDRPKRKVSASVVVVTRTATARISATYQIIDVKTGRILRTGDTEKGVVYSTSFGRYRGDKEALTYRSRQVCAVRETYPPSDDELVRQAAEEAARDLAAEIAGYFR